MPLVYYNLVGGEAPWEDATSMESSSTYTNDSANVNPGSNYTSEFQNNETVEYGTSYYRKGAILEGHSTRTNHVSYVEGATDIDTGSGYAGSSAYGFTQLFGQTDYASVHQSAGNYFSEKSASGFQSGATTSANHFHGAGTGGTVDNHESEFGSSSSSSSSSGITSMVSNDGFYATFYVYQTYAWASAEHANGAGAGSTVDTTTHTVTNSFSNGTTGGSVEMSSTSYVDFSPIGSQQAVTSWTLGASFEDYFQAPSTFNGERNITVSTESTLGEGTATYTAPSTTDNTQAYTYIGVVGSTSVGHHLEPAYATYFAGVSHLLTIVEATRGEVLRFHTNTGSTPVDIVDLVGATYTKITLSNYASSGIEGFGVSFTESSLTRTISYPGMSVLSSTIVVSTMVSISYTEQSNGWIGDTGHVTKNLYGNSTTTQATTYGRTTYYTDTHTGGYPVVSWVPMSPSGFRNEVMYGINGVGDSVDYIIQEPDVTYEWVSFLNYQGAAGETVTIYRSPDGNPLYAGVDHTAGMTKLERVDGYQAPGSIGWDKPQGRELIAPHTFIADYFQGAHSNLLTPVEASSSHVVSDSTYKYALGTDAVWSVTSYSSGLSGTETTYESSSFTAYLTLANVGDKFNLDYEGWSWAAGWSELPLRTQQQVFGGHSAGVAQVVTVTGFGLIYTLGDSTGGTSASKFIGSAYRVTANLGNSVMAMDSYSAGLANRGVKPGAVSYVVLPYAY